MSLGLDMVNGFGCNHATITQAVLTQMIVALQNTGSLDIPLITVATLMTCLTLLMLLPALITVLIAVTRAVSCCSGASTLTTSARY